MKSKLKARWNLKKNFFFTFIEKECEAFRYAESQERNVERNKKDMR